MLFGIKMSGVNPDRGTPLGDAVALVDLIREPMRARVYTHVRRVGMATVADVVESLDVQKREVYDHVTELEDAGFLRVISDERPAKYAASEIDLTLDANGRTRRITPAFVEAVSLSETDEDVSAYVDRHGVDGLATALEYARKYADGSVNHRIMARELDILPLEASIILEALRDVVDEDRED